MQLPSLVVTVLLCVLCAWPQDGAAWDGERAAQIPVYFAVDAGAAARQAAGMTGGRVLDVQTRFAGTRAVYVIKVLLNDGRVKVIEIEGAQSTMPSMR